MALRELLARFGVQVDTKELSEADKQLDSAKESTADLFGELDNLKGAFLAAGAAIAVTKLTEYTKEVLDAAAATKKFADQTDVAFDEFQQWEAIAGSVGAETEDLRDALVDLADRAEDFAMRGAGEGADAFEALNIEVKNADGTLRKSTDLFVDLAVGLSEMEDQTAATGLAIRAFGDSGFRILPALKGSREEILANIEAASRMGVVFDEEFAKQAGQAKKEIFFFQRQLLGLRVSLVQAFLPTIRESIRWITETIAAFRAFDRQTGFVQRAIKSLGVMGFVGGVQALAAQFGGIGPLLQKLLPLVNRLAFAFLKFALPFLIIEDFFTFLEGGDSIIGRLLESFGLIDDASKAGKEFGKVWKEQISPAISTAAIAVGKFFGEAYAGIVLLGAMFGITNQEISDDLERRFMTNTNTIQDFFDWIGRNVTTYLYQPFASAISAIEWFFTGAITEIIFAVIVAGTQITGTFNDVVQTVAGAVAYLVSYIDMIFGTDLAGAVQGAADNITGAFSSAWENAASGLQGLIDEITKTGTMVKNLILDPIGEAAKIITGSTDEAFGENIEAINHMNREAAARRAANRNVTLTDQRTINVNASGVSPAVARQTAAAVSGALTSDRRAIAAAVGG